MVAVIIALVAAKGQRLAGRGAGLFEPLWAKLPVEERIGGADVDQQAG